ncbi:uncharacterized protein METZ01_LOCUS164447 [marine metagenome]|uniref:Uncharacterized protein n=1 Tax=marine metagenome TaxID=408172 RepID=A0A382BEB7_9ZZZZ
MVGCDTQGLQTFLDVDTNSTATSPKTDNETGPEAGVVDSYTELEAVFHDLLL